MSVDGNVLAMVIALGFITALTRVGGYWLGGRITISARVAAALNLIPGTIITALIAPSIVNEGVNGLVATGATVVLMRKTGNLIASLIAGLGILILLRNLDLV